METANQAIIDFIRSIQPPENGALGYLQQQALYEQVPIIPPEVARLLHVLLALKPPKRILEIGCAVGFSAALMCQHLEENGHIDTIDRYDIMIEAAEANFDRLGLRDKVTLWKGDAAEILPGLPSPYDVIFLDAGKGQYLPWLSMCLQKLAVGGLLIADDVLQGGRVALDRFAVPRRQRTTHARMRKFLHALAHTPGLTACILPLGDGVALAVKTGEVPGTNA